MPQTNAAPSVGDESVVELIAMFDAATQEEGCTIFDHTPEEFGLHVMENWQAIRAALSPTEDETPADAGDVCANCKGMFDDLADGRDPEELCDTCYQHATEALAAHPAPADEYMTVTLSTDGTVTSHHSFDADWDEMVAATQKIIDALQERMAGRGHCPFARINAAAPTDTGLVNGTGWVFWNPDSGEEYAPQHPITSGEVPEAERIRRSTPQEDVLWQAFQGEFERAHALSKSNTGLVEERAPTKYVVLTVKADGSQWGTEHSRHDSYDEARAVARGISVFGNISAWVSCEINAPVEEPAKGETGTCTYCDGSGDVHRADGEWLGGCPCFTSGQAAPTDTGLVGELVEALAWIDQHKDDQDMNHVNFRISAGSRARTALAKAKDTPNG